MFSARQRLADEAPLPAGSPATLSLPPRAALALALLATREAAETTDAQKRNRSLLLAQRYLDTAQSQRPFWGEADVAASFIAFARYGAQAPATLAAYARSYRTAPYIETSATWRIRYGMAAFPALSPDVRHAMLNEAAWVSTWSPRHFSLIGSIAGPARADDLRKARFLYNRLVHFH